MRSCAYPMLLPLLLALIAGQPTMAAEANLDSVLQGFDEPADNEHVETSEPTALEAVLGGFEDANKASTPTAEDLIEQSPWQTGGALTLGTSYNYAHKSPPIGKTDYRGLSRFRAKLNLEFEMDLAKKWQGYLSGYAFYDAAYQLNGRDDYQDEVLDEYEREAELGEAWLQGQISSRTDLKLGRQIVVWGKSDNLRITDIINPLDNREPGMVDIEDLRLPLTMVRLDHYSGDWGFSALAIPEIRFSKTPPLGSEFYPFAAPMAQEITPKDGGEHTEYALAANGIFRGWDLSLYWAQFYDDNPNMVIRDGTPQLQHNRLTMQGLATNVAIENWLIKAEAAYFSGLEYTSLPNEELSRVDTLLGVEYAGFRDTTVSMEIANRHMNQYDKTLLNEGIKEDVWQTAVRYQGDFLHARLHLLALISAFGKALNEGGFGRYSAAYDIADALTLTGGIVSYEGGDQFPFSSIADNDRLFLDLKYSF